MPSGKNDLNRFGYGPMGAAHDLDEYYHEVHYNTQAKILIKKKE